MRRNLSFSSSVSASSPPNYYASSVAPSYSSQPSPDEQRLAFSGRPAPRPLPRGTYTKKRGRFVLRLKNQEEGSSQPSYGRGAVIGGDVQLGNKKDFKVISIILKLEGRLHLTVGEGFHNAPSFMCETYTLWENDRSQGQTCPTVVPFDIILPFTCNIGDRSPRLPPSYNVAFRGVPGLFAKCTYSLTVSITESRGLGIFKRKKCSNLSTPLNYFPRTRPHQPILPSNFSFRSTLKASPEEWHQVISTMASRSNSGFEPIDCHLFIPSVQIYGLSDTIPFFVQLRGPLASLSAFLHPTAAEHLPPKYRLTAKPTIRVFLYRQVTVEVRHQKAWRTCVLGEGKLTALPSEAGQGDDGRYESLDWEGTVRCKEDVVVGGFRAGPLVIKDFIVLSLVPPFPQTSPLIEHQHAHPIRLVTDPFMELLGPIAPIATGTMS